MGDFPGPSTAPYLWRGKTGENFARLCQFIMTICSDVLRDVVSRFIKPSDLRARLDSERPNLERTLNVQQKTELYPKTPSVASTNIRTKNFDISLLYTLLRNICGIQVCDLPAHKKKGWGKTPPPGDFCLCACIEIIREVRNNVTGHIGTGSVEDKDFHTYWNQLKEAVLAIEKEMTGADMYERGIDELYSCDLNPTITAKYVLELKAIKETVNLKRERIEDLEETSHNIEEQLVVKKEKIDTQEMRLQKLEREVNCSKQQSVEQEERIIKRVSEQSVEQEERIIKRVSEQSVEQEERIIKRVSEQSVEQEERIIKRVSELITEQDGRILKRISERSAEAEERLIKPVPDHQLKYKSVCRIHPTLECFMFCMPCQSPVCVKCIIEQHQQHVLDELIKNGIVSIKMKMTGKVTKVTEFVMTFDCSHMSCLTSDKAWIGDWKRLSLVNVHGNVLKQRERRNDSRIGGYFTVGSNGDLLLIDGTGIKRITQDDGIQTIIDTDIEPTCIYSSLLNNDILVGVGDQWPYIFYHSHRKFGSKVVRYNAVGQKLREIVVGDHSDLHYIAYITENRFNGDICSVESSLGLSLKVFGKLGEYRFTYTGPVGSKIIGSVTTDFLGHILLPMQHSNRHECHVDILNHNGEFLRTLLTTYSLLGSVSLCTDNMHRLWFAYNNRVEIYRYLEEVK